MRNTECGFCVRKRDGTCVGGFNFQCEKYQQVPSLGDQIRAMDDEELSAYLMKITGTQKRNQKRWLKRLQQPA